MTEELDYKRAFGGVGRLYGDAGWENLKKSHAVVIGLGGVGSWAAEALVRTAIGTVTLIDLDNVAESNTNRQLQAMVGEFGKPKIQVLAERFQRINPHVCVNLVEDFVDEENLADLIPDNANVVLDCIDQVRVKAAICAFCRRKAIPVITSGAAGGRRDPSQIQHGDLGRISGDPLLSKVRHTLRKKYGFPAAQGKLPGKKFGITAVYSTEPVVKSQSQCEVQTDGGLACAGYGSSVCMTATTGMIAASLALELMTKGR